MKIIIKSEISEKAKELEIKEIHAFSDTELLLVFPDETMEKIPLLKMLYVKD